MIDVTVHPRLMRQRDGTVVDGQIVDTVTQVRLAATQQASDPNEAYCSTCGEDVDVWSC
jgi:hypothetical protein